MELVGSAAFAGGEEDALAVGGGWGGRGVVLGVAGVGGGVEGVVAFDEDGGWELEPDVVGVDH